jgi:hypothetical protein
MALSIRNGHSGLQAFSVDRSRLLSRHQIVFEGIIRLGFRLCGEVNHGVCQKVKPQGDHMLDVALPGKWEEQTGLFCRLKQVSRNTASDLFEVLCMTIFSVSSSLFESANDKMDRVEQTSTTECSALNIWQMIPYSHCSKVGIE